MCPRGEERGLGVRSVTDFPLINGRKVRVPNLNIKISDIHLISKSCLRKTGRINHVIIPLHVVTVSHIVIK